MKLIIAGTRTLRASVEEISGYIKKFNLNPTEIVSGREKKGIDHCGEEWADAKGIRVKPFPANWAKFGRPAGPIRNVQMAEYADELLLIWNGKSSGSTSMKEAMENLGKPVWEIIL